MKKIRKKIPIQKSFYWNINREIPMEEIIENIQELKGNGVTHIEFETYHDERNNETSMSVYAFTKRMETDEELQARIDYESDKYRMICQEQTRILKRLSINTKLKEAY